MAFKINGNRGAQQEISGSTEVSKEIVSFQQEFTTTLPRVPRTFPLGHVPAWKSDLLRALPTKLRFPSLCQNNTISSQAWCRLHNDLSDK